MTREPTDEQKEIARDLLGRGAYPLPEDNKFVTRAEVRTMIEDGIKLAIAQVKLWVVLGAVSTVGSVIVAVVGGVMLLQAKINHLADAMPAIASVQANRSSWILYTQQRDDRQDDALSKLDKSYKPLPYKEPPQ